MKQDYGEAMSLCSSAAKKRYAQAEYCLGYLYQRGLGATQDSKEAAKWYSEAAVHGNTKAALTLAEMHLKGEGVAVDRPEAYYLLFLAYEHGATAAKSQAYSLQGNMSKDENKRLDKKLRQHLLDPKKVYAIVNDPTSPDPAKTRKVLPPVVR